jgi:uncharacterized protein
MPNPILGRGWSFPVRIDGRGGIARSDDQRDIEESIQVILGTRQGERVMRPNFGCKIHELAFAPVNAHTLGLAQRYVEEALGWWEPRVEVTDIQVTTDPSLRSVGKLIIEIQYRVKDTKDERTLVYPFYLIGED